MTPAPALSDAVRDGKDGTGGTAGGPGFPMLERGRYRARRARMPADLDAVFALRGRVFRGGTGRSDRDGFDALCQHILIEDVTQPDPVAAFRLKYFDNGAGIARAYAAQSYDLTRLERYPGPLLELGRFCIAPGARDPDIPRIAWAALTRHVDALGVRLLFGCTSFAGTDPAPHADAFAWLAAHHRAPRAWRPGRRAAATVALAPADTGAAAPSRHALKGIPPLLRTYLSLGGWVSDHAVVDPDMNTLHVFTGVEIARIPPARADALRRLGA